MTVKSITNTTGSTISLKEAGVDLTAGETYVIYAVHYPLFAYAARSGSFLESQINAANITVSDGLTPALSAALGLSLLRDILARNISFDNRFDGFLSTNVQAAIEEARNSAIAYQINIPLACSSSANVGDLVVPSLTADTTVTSISSNVNTGLVIGIIGSKPTPTTCFVQTLGRISGYSGLTRGLPVFVSATGTPTTTPPTGPLQIIGNALSATDFILYISMRKVVR